MTAIGQHTTTGFARWYGAARRRPQSACTLFCLPYSGGGATMFYGWQRLIDTRVEVAPIHLPGREDREDEPLSHSAEAIAAAVIDRAQDEPPLGIPLVGLAGAEDPEAGPGSMRGWSRQTRAPFGLHTLPGDHFFLRSAATEVTSLLAADMLRALGQGAW